MAVGKLVTHERHGFERERCTLTGLPLCRWCWHRFEPHDARQEFCDTSCKARWNRYWEVKGPKLARLMYEFRYQRTDGALTDMCNEFAMMVEKFDRQRRERRDDGTC